jgi:transposase
VTNRLKPLFVFPSFPDTISTVIQRQPPAARRARRKSSPQPTVNNCAEAKNLRLDYNGPGRVAPRRSRSFVSRLSKAQRSSPVGAAAVVMSERTIAPEAPSIRMTADGPALRTTKSIAMKNWTEITHYAGLDWARDHHDIIITDRQGQIVADLRIEHSLAGWKQWAEQIKIYPGLAVALETAQGAAVDQLLQLDCTVYPVNPLSAKSYRQRKAPSGTKTDRLDAWALADALRLEGQQWKALRPLDPLTQQIQLLCRDEISLIEQRTQLINQLQQALYEYYPAALEAFDDWTRPSTWDFILQFPTPAALAKAGRRRWEKFLHSQKLWRPETAQRRLEIFQRAQAFTGSPAVTSAKSLLAESLASLLNALQARLDRHRQQIEALFKEHPDRDLFGSLPGAAETLAPRLLGEVGGDAQRFTDTANLQAVAGTAPVSFQSGQIHKVRVRYQCNKVLRHTVHLWAQCCLKRCPWAQVYYGKKRAEGKSHACALRCLGQRLLKILWRMIQTRQTYDGELHARNQQKHGSWVLKLLSEAAAVKPIAKELPAL